MYKKLSDSDLMQMSKWDIIKILRCAENNWESALATVEQQYENTKNWQPVRHGKWYWNHYGLLLFACSECNNLSEYKTSYCAYCGAKMDGECNE